MAITIGRIDNKFWDNSSYKQPNSFPIYDKQITLDKVRPSLNSFISGDIYLKGGDWNHCLYKGVYYALKILRILDPEKDLYHYRLERELWFDVLKANAKVIGDLTTSSDESLLSEHIHKTVGILDNPTRVTTINFKTGSTSTNKPFEKTEVIKIGADLRQKVLTKNKFDSFWEKIHTPFDWTEINNYFYSGIRNPGVFILARLDSEARLIDGWKEKVKEKVNEFLETLKEKQGELRLSKLTGNFATQLIGKYIVTQQKDGFGSSHEPYELPLIDLSRCTDIKPLNSNTLKEPIPETLLNFTGESGGLFEDVTGVDEDQSEYVGKISSISYTPVGADRSTWGDLPMFELKYDDTINIKWLGTRPPQIIQWTYKGESGQANLWWKDNLNGILLDGTRGIGATPLNLFSNLPKISSWIIVKDIYEMLTDSRWISSDSYKENIYNTWTHIPFSYPLITTTNTQNIIGSGYFINTTNYEDAAVDPFWGVGKEERVSLGFLLFQNKKNIADWDLFEYKGGATLNNIDYASGISTDFFSYYDKKDEYWSDLRDDKLQKKNLALLQPKGSEAFVKAYIDNYWLWWLAFLPQPYIPFVTKFSLINPTYPGTWTTTSNWFKDGLDPYGIYYYRGYRNFAFQQIRSDINKGRYNDYTKTIETSPLASDHQYKSFKVKKWRNLSSKLLWNNIQLPEGLVIEKGDYFFSDVDYTIKNYNRLIFPNSKSAPWILPENKYNPKSIYKVAIINSAKNEDNIMPLPEKTPDSGVFLCTRKDGRLDLRILKTFTRTLTLSTVPKQTVQSVNGDDKRITKFFLFKSKHVIETAKEPTENDKKNILKDVYDLLGHSVGFKNADQTGTPPSPTWLWYSKQELEEKQLLFDLEGTQWYCLLNKGKVNLILKDPNKLRARETNAQYLDHESNKKYGSAEDPDKPLSLLERVNQKVQFRFLTASYDLNWKSNFDNSDSLALRVITSNPTNKRKGLDHYFVSLDTKHDVIWWETISVSKLEHNEAVAQLADGVEIDRFNLEMLNAHRSYEANQGRYLLSQKRINENIRRAQKQLEIQRMQADLNFSTGLISALSGGSVELGSQIQGIQEYADTWTGSDKWIDASLASPEQMATYGSFTRARRGVPQINIGDKHKQGIPIGSSLKVGATAISKGASMARLIGNYAIQQAHIFPEQQRKINMDKKLAAEQLALQSLQMNTQHMNKQINAQLEMNRIFSRYDVPAITSTDLNQEFRDNETIHGKKLQKHHLVVYTPSAEQLKYLKEYVDEYGIGCDIPDIEYSFFSGMNPGIIRYRNIEDKGIRGITNIAVREYIRTRLFTGVKIVELEKTTPDEGCLTLGQFKELLSNIKVQYENEKSHLQGQLDEAINIVNKTASTFQIDLSGWRTLEDKLKNALKLIKEQQSKTTNQAFNEIKQALGLDIKVADSEITRNIRGKLQRIQNCEEFENGIKTALELPANAVTGTINMALNKKLSDLKAYETGYGTYRKFENDLWGYLEAAKLVTGNKNAGLIKTKVQEQINKVQECNSRDEDIKKAFGIQEVNKDTIQKLMDSKGAKGIGLTCEQFRKLAGHTKYELTDQTLIENIERLCLAIAVTVQYTLSFGVDQLFSQEHDLQPVFKDLYELGENDLVSAFMDTLVTDGWKQMISIYYNKRVPEDGKTRINNSSRAEAEWIHDIFLKYTESANDGRLFNNTDRDLVVASEIVYTDMISDRLDDDKSVTKEIYAIEKVKALKYITPANLNQLKELLDDLSYSLEKATINYAKNHYRGDYGMPSEDCLDAMHDNTCEEINFMRLCYSFLRYYKEIWPIIEGTDIPYGVAMTALVKEAEECQHTIDFELIEEGFVKHGKSFIYPAIGLYSYNPRWPKWSFNGYSIRRGKIRNHIQKTEGYQSGSSLENIRVENRKYLTGIRTWKQGYEFTREIRQNKSLKMMFDWCKLYISGYRGLNWDLDIDWPLYAEPNWNDVKVFEAYICISGEARLEDYYSAREKFFNRAIQHIDKIFENYQPKKITISTTRLGGRPTSNLALVDNPYLAQDIFIDDIFGYESWKYALIQLATMHIFRLRWKILDPGDVYNLIYLEPLGFVKKKPQPFESWDDTRFLNYIKPFINRTSFYISPDFAEAQDLFRHIFKHLKIWVEPMKGTPLERWIKEDWPTTQR